MTQNFSHINQVPQSTALIDIAFSKTNRKTPTIVRAKYEIHRIRSFYIRKIKFTAETLTNKLDGILKEFPVLEDIHPFYSDMIGILYDKDHYKISLGQVSSAKHRIETIAKENTRLLKYADSLYRCKELKKATLGRMATAVKKLGESFTYLEEVRQHMSRLPSVDTGARTLVICGFPNVGKSSFMNAISRAHVDVQPYAFTTKSIFLGHFEHENLRWQVLDTPGILDHPLSDRSSVEMLTIAALAHLKSAVLFFMDLSETCGHTVEEQLSLYRNLAPLLNLQILIVFSKADLTKLADVSNENLRVFLEDKKYLEMSVADGYNITEVKETICGMLLNERIAEKQGRMDDLATRIRPVVPFRVNDKYDGVHLGTSPFIGLHENETYYCDNKYDVIPEIYNGKNISDFIDVNITQKVDEVAKLVDGDTLRRYDIMGREEREMYAACNNARIAATMRANLARRASMPQSWKNKINSRGELIADNPVVTPVVKVERPSHNKKVSSDYGVRHFDMKPKHSFRPKSGRTSKR
ncbi:nucleolar GTP-binding protein [Pancytospora epiphaga]|nr:nucleolar GTP-binding protein [Pancytospora epiphaga]